MANPSPLLDFDVAALSQKLRAKEISPVELTQAYLDRIEAVDERIISYITVTAEAARTMARAKPKRKSRPADGAGRFTACRSGSRISATPRAS